MRTSFAVSCLIVVVCVSSTLASITTTHYDINFEGPRHTAGSTVSIDDSIYTPSSVRFGNPSIVSHGTGQWLEFNTAGNRPSFYYDQIALDLGHGYNNYSLSFDLWSQNYVGSGSNNRMTVLFDTPQVRNLYFKPDGSIEFYNVSGHHHIGTFSDFTWNHIDIHIDLLQEEASILMNNSLLFKGVFYPGENDINHIRYSFGLRSSRSALSVDDTILIDNIKVTSTIPLPSSVLLLSIGVTSVLGLRRKKLMN